MNNYLLWIYVCVSGTFPGEVECYRKMRGLKGFFSSISQAPNQYIPFPLPWQLKSVLWKKLFLSISLDNLPCYVFYKTRNITLYGQVPVNTSVIQYRFLFIVWWKNAVVDLQFYGKKYSLCSPRAQETLRMICNFYTGSSG